MSRRAPWLLFSVVMALPALARAQDKAACIAASEKAQQQRTDGKLIDAKKSFAVCASASCPSVLVRDCTDQLAQVVAATPSIVVVVRDAAGNDITAARVTMDGTLVADGLNGRAIEFDPGKHTVRVEVAGAAPSEKEIVFHEGEKQRVVAFNVTPRAAQAIAPAGSPAGVPDAPAQGQVTADAPPQPPSGQVRQHGVVPWVVFGIGAAALVGGGVMYVVGGQMVSDSKAGCTQSSGAFTCGTLTASEVESRQSQNANGATLGNVGLIVGSAGAALALTGLVWHFLEPTGKRASRAWTLVPGVASVALSGVF